MKKRYNDASSALYYSGNLVDFWEAMNWAEEQFLFEIEEGHRQLQEHPELDWDFETEENHLRQVRLASLVYDLHAKYIEDEDEARTLALAELQRLGEQKGNDYVGAIAQCMEFEDYRPLAC